MIMNRWKIPICKTKSKDYWRNQHPNLSPNQKREASSSMDIPYLTSKKRNYAHLV